MCVTGECNMAERSYKFTLFGPNANRIINDMAFKYKLEQENVKPKYMPIFEYFDQNNDKVLDAQELAEFKTAFDNVNNDADKFVISKKEAEALLQNLFGDTKVNNKVLYGFLEAVQKNYVDNVSNISDGKIDLFAQGAEGNCWLLSQVNAMSKTSWGAEAIKQSILDNPEEQKYTIRLEGVNFACDIGYDEVEKEKNNPKRPLGDIDMLLLDIATEKYFQSERELNNISKKENHLLDGGQIVGKYSMQYLLTGKYGNKFNFYAEKLTPEEIEYIKDMFKKYPEIVDKHNQDKERTFDICDKSTAVKFLNTLAQQEDNVIACSFKKSRFWDNSEQYKHNGSRNDFTSQTDHAYSIEELITDENGNVTEVILNNPWASDILIHKSINEFLDQVATISVTNREDVYTNLSEMCEPYWVNVINQTP